MQVVSIILSNFVFNFIGLHDRNLFNMVKGYFPQGQKNSFTTAFRRRLRCGVPC